MSPTPEVHPAAAFVVYDAGSLRTRIVERRRDLIWCFAASVTALVCGALAISYTPWLWAGVVIAMVCAAAAEIANPLSILCPPVRRIVLSDEGIETIRGRRSVERSWVSMTEVRIWEGWATSCTVEIRTARRLKRVDLGLIGTPAQVAEAVDGVRAAAEVHGVPVVMK